MYLKNLIITFTLLSLALPTTVRSQAITGYMLTDNGSNMLIVSSLFDADGSGGLIQDSSTIFLFIPVDLTNSPISDHLYYRLKMVDANAMFEYLPTRSARVAPSGHTVRIQPNAAIDALHITLPSLGAHTHITATLYDSTGKQALQTAFQATTPLNVSTLPRGTYTLQLTDSIGLLVIEQVVIQ